MTTIDNRVMYGLDIGGTKIELAIFRNDFELVESWREPTPKDDYGLFVKAITDLVHEADRKCDARGTIGIGMPGVKNEQGEYRSSNLPALNGHDLVGDLAEIFERAIRVENDARTFVISELNGGAIDRSYNSLGVILGTGLAGSQCVNGRIVQGKQGVLGEYGHIAFSAAMMDKYRFPVRKCGCGNVGCVEPYLSGTGLKWMCSHFDSVYKRAPDLIAGLHDGDSTAKDVFDAYIDCLGNFFAQLTLIFDPEKIVLGGGLSKISEIYDELPQSIQRHLFTGVTPPIILPPVFGDSSGVRGAAILGSESMQPLDGQER